MICVIVMLILAWTMHHARGKHVHEKMCLSLLEVVSIAVFDMRITYTAQLTYIVCQYYKNAEVMV